MISLFAGTDVSVITSFDAGAQCNVTVSANVYAALSCVISTALSTLISIEQCCHKRIYGALRLLLLKVKM